MKDKKLKPEFPAKTEEQNLDVFGTKEVSVKEFMGSTDKNLILLSSPKLAKENLIALKEKHEKRAEELILIEKLSPAELKELNVIRGELRDPRYLVQKIQTNNTSVFEAYKKTDKANLSELIEINKSLEDKVDEKIKAEDERKKREKEEEKKADENRIKAIKDKIDAFESASYEIIQKMTFDDIKSSKDKLSALEETDFDFEEYDISYDKAKDRVISALDTKVETLTKNENQRLDNIRLEKENAEVKRKADLQAERLNEIMPYVAFGVAVDLTKLSELTDENYTEILKGKKELFDADVLEKEQAEDARKAKEAEEKEAILIIRRNRLNEIGFNFAEFQGFNHRVFQNVKVNSEEVYAASTVEFENILVEAKKSIESAKVEAESKLLELRINTLKEIGFETVVGAEYPFVLSDKIFTNSEILSTRDAEWFKEFVQDSQDYLQKLADDQKESDRLKAIADAEKLKAENKARIKKYAVDKKSAIEYLESFTFTNPVPEFENEDFSNHFNWVLKQLEDYAKAQTEKLKTF